MDLYLKNRIVVVTGSSHGVGKVIVEALAREGAEAIVCGRNRTRVAETQAGFLASGYRVKGATLDVTRPEEVREFFQSMIAPQGRLDILVNNVGGAERFGGFLDLADEDWRRAYDLNFMSAVYFSRAAVPFLKKSDAGRIINISSVPARQPGKFNPHYSAAKAALLNLSKHLSNILAADNILVNAICPSTLKGGGWDANVGDRARHEHVSPEEAAARMEEEERRKNPLGRMGTPEDIANLVAFLASPCAGFITGTCIDADGGTIRSIF